MRASAKKLMVQGPVEGKWDLPAGWEWKRLGEVGSANRKKIRPITKPDLPYIGMEHIEPHTGIQCGQDIFGQMKSTGVHFFPDDVLYGRLRPYLNKVFLAKNEGTCSPEFIVFEENKHTSPKYLVYFLRSGDFVNFASHPDNTSGERPRIDYATIAAHPIPLPPTIQDQERIVERIDSLFAELDKAEEALRHTITLCEQYKQSVLKAAVTGELSKEWRKANPPTETGEQLLQRILKERRAAWVKAELAKMTAKGQKPANDLWKKKYKEPQTPDTSGLPELPEGWTWASMDMLADVKGGITVDRKKVYNISVPYLRVANVQEGYLDLSEVKMITASQEIIENLRLEKGDILLNEGGDRDKLGRGWVWNNDLPLCIHQNHVFRARLFLKEFVSEFISIYTNTFGKQFFFDEGKQTTNLASISMTKLKSIPIPIPPVSEQRYIFDSITKYINENSIILDICSKSKTQSTALRQSILKQAFTGQLT